MMTREDYYAQIGDIYARIYSESHAPCLSYRSKMGKKEKHEDQALIEDGTVKREANAEVVSAIVKKEQIQEIQEMRDNIKRFSESMEETRAVSKVEEAMVREKAEALECASNLKIPASVYDMDSHVKEMEEFSHQSTNGSGKKIAHQLFDQMPSKEKQRKCLKAWKFKFKPTSKRSKTMGVKFFSVEEIAWLTKESKEINGGCVNKEFKEAVAGCEKKKKGLKSWMFKYKKGNKKRDLLLLNGKASLALRAIGTGLETVERDSSNQEKSRLCTEDKGGLKGCLERLQASVLRKEESESMVVNEVKAEFKTFDRKRSDRTLSLEDKQDDEHEQNQVIKLISSLNNRIWEPGGVLIEHDRWKDLEKCYKHGRLRRLMQPLSSMWWQLSKSREFEKLGACSLVDIKTWLDLCSREYKNHMLLLDYHGIEMQVLSCLLEIGFRASMSMESKARLWTRDIECIRKRKVDLSLITHCKLSILEYTKEVEILSEKIVADEMLLPGHHGLLHTFDQCGGLNATVIAGTIMQSSLKSFHQLRVACLHHTSLGFLYGSLPRPPEESHSNFSNMPQYHETWSCISLRTNRVWDPGGSNSETD